jgi:anti-sigma regulatory factor (Ser/Thr protein kinase)/CheY-like chemotaxis protein
VHFDRLLMVQEDPSVRESLARLLERKDRRLKKVSGGAEALGLLRAERFDLVVAGQGRNGTDSIKLLRRLQTVRPDTKVILTGEPDPSRAISAVRAHAYGYLHWPFSGSQVSDMVQQALGASSWREDIRVVSGRPEWFTMDVRCRLEAAERATHLARELASDLDASACEDVTAAFRELLLNGIEHGGRSNPRKHVRVSVLRAAHAIMVHMRDPGKGFSFETIAHAAVSNPENLPTRHVEIREKRGQRPGGFGILMASNLVDQLLYNERGNEVFFVKKLD